MRAGKHARMRHRRQRNGSFPAPPEAPKPPVSEKEPLQIRIPTDIKRRFKACAALRGMAPHELFVEVWKYYEKSLP
jgi:hypothetical protein